MKNMFLVLTVMLSIVTLLTGCGANPDMNANNNGQRAMQSAEDFVENAGDKIENGVEQTVDKITGNGNVDTSKFIGEAKAKEIALKKANLTSDGVTFDKVELDHDDGVWQYEVEFRKDGHEYDADIRATDGEIIKWDEDYND